MENLSIPYPPYCCVNANYNIRKKLSKYIYENNDPNKIIKNTV
jgi:hypothetical protein